MARYYIHCPYCGLEYPYHFKGFKCERCGKPLSVNIEVNVEMFKYIKGRGVWRYRPFLPEFKIEPISLGEGGTPIIERRYGNVKVFYKLDYLNPTGSFKDRGSTVAITRALELGVKRIFEDSSGNTGISVSAYGAIAGLEVRIYVPRDAPKGKLAIMELFGAKIVKAGSRNEAARKVLEDLGPEDYYIGHTWNPFFIEGTKTLAYEVYEEVKSIEEVIVPVASGSNLLGIYKGFKELLNMGLIDHLPRLIAVQVEGYAPVYEAFTGRKAPCKEPSKLADALRLTIIPRLYEIVRALKETKGDVIVVSDNEIIQALRRLYKMGFTVEPTSAVVQVALEKMTKEKELNGPTLAVLTGSGLKMVHSIYEVALK